MEIQEKEKVLFYEQLNKMFAPKTIIHDEIKDVKVSIGDTIEHKRFGHGTVIEIIDYEKVKIQFDGFEKILLKNFAGF
jgi:hypothetical protein